MRAYTYTMTALAMRYFFIAAILFILLQLVVRALGEYREMRRVKRQVAGAYTHYIVFTDPPELRGARYALRKETVLGSGKGCGVRLCYRGVRRRQGSLYQNGEVMWFSTRSKRGVFFNGEPMRTRKRALEDGDVIEIFGVRFAYKTRRENAGEATTQEVRSE